MGTTLCWEDGENSAGIESGVHFGRRIGRCGCACVGMEESCGSGGDAQLGCYCQRRSEWAYGSCGAGSRLWQRYGASLVVGVQPSYLLPRPWLLWVSGCRSGHGSWRHCLQGMCVFIHLALSLFLSFFLLQLWQNVIVWFQVKDGAILDLLIVFFLSLRVSWSVPSRQHS